jgi:hypothetical protein
VNLGGKHLHGLQCLIGYFDLVGTKSAYAELKLDRQIERISTVISAVWEGLADSFTEKEIADYLYIHMYSDSVVSSLC